MARLLTAALALTLAAAVAGGCADDHAAGRPLPVVDLALDFTPNAVHAPIYAAVRRGLDRANGIALRIRQPGQGPDALKLVASGRVALGVLDIGDLALARRRGIDIVAVGELVDKPLAALIAQPQIRRPRDLEGRTVGVSGLPSDPAFVRAIMRHDGGDIRRVRQVTIGFEAVSTLLTGRVAAVPAFWNAEGVALRRRGRAVREFRIEDYGAPAYPEVVLMTARATLRRHRDRVLAAVRAIAAGIGEVRAHPAAAVRQIAAAAQTGDLGLIGAQLDAVAPLFAPGMRMDRGVIGRWADFELRIGLIDRRPQVDRAFDFTLAR
ncbi:MAG: putative hydroxymethylpyrimidine transport system substrate-binding protein [Solirubrobacteraceae bacterium]|nr:putative hydroxymethylpyrimidine transport system substrate-binding protein [Solirubrobacteraceae bacterium]